MSWHWAFGASGCLHRALGLRPTGFPSCPPAIHGRCAHRRPQKPRYRDHQLTAFRCREPAAAACRISRAGGRDRLACRRERPQELRTVGHRPSIGKDPGPGVFQTGESRRRFRRRRAGPLLSLGASGRGATRAGERSCHCLAAGHAPYGLLLAAHSPSCGVLSTRRTTPGTGLPVPAATEVPRLSSIVIGSFTSLGDRSPRSFVVCSELPLRHSLRPSGRFRGAETRSSPLPIHEGLSQFGSVSEPTHRQALTGPLMVELSAVRYLPGTPG